MKNIAEVLRKNFNWEIDFFPDEWLNIWLNQQIKSLEINKKEDYLCYLEKNATIEYKNWKKFVSTKIKEQENKIKKYNAIIKKYQQELVESRDSYVFLHKHLQKYNEQLYNINQELEQREKETLISQAKFEAIGNHTSDIVITFDFQGNITYVTPSIKRLVGRETKEILNTNLKSLIHREDFGNVFQIFKQALKIPDKTLIISEFRVQHKDSRWIILEGLIKKLPDEANLKELVVNCRDITIKRKVEKRLNKLNIDLINQNHELAKKEEALEYSNQILHQKQIALEGTLKELSKKNFELDQLVYKTSHDLRSPLLSILGLINLTKLDVSEEMKIEALERIEKSVKRLDKFVVSLLDYGKSNSSALEIEDIDLQAFTEACIEDIRYKEEFTGVETQITLLSEDTYIRTDVVNLRIIFNNIISNAFKYANFKLPKSFLKISIEVGKEKTKIIFEDNGIGISEEYLHQVFDMFVRVTEKSEGSGLGLYIVKQTVERLSGKIIIKSKKNKGTTFIINLPTKQ